VSSPLSSLPPYLLPVLHPTYLPLIVVDKKISKAKSQTIMEELFLSQLQSLHPDIMRLKKAGATKQDEKKAIDRLFDESSSDDNSVVSGEEEIMEEGGKEEANPEELSQLIDEDLVQLLKLCHELKTKFKATEDYETELMMRQVEL